MAIDMGALERAAKGDPDGKVTVRKAWLAEVLGAIFNLGRPLRS